MDVVFNQLGALHWLWPVVGLVAVVAWGFVARRRQLRRLADHELLARLLPQVSVARQVVRAGLVVAALVALVAAMIDPRWGVRYVQVQQRGIDIIAVLDVSRSMLAEDVTPNRLERAKQYIADLAGQLRGDRIGLVTFAGVPAVKCPLTVDYGALRLSLDEVGPESAQRGGSLLGDALRLAGDSFTDDVPDYKAVIVLSDGEDHGSYPLEAAVSLWEEKGIRVYTVGIGDADEGARIPVEVDGQRVFLIHEGQEVWSKMNAEALRAMALSSGGAYVPAGTSQADFARLYTERIEPAAKRQFEAAQVRRYTARYQWFAGLAFALLIIEALVSDRRPNRRPASATSERLKKVALT